MKNLFKAGLILISTTLSLSACGSNVTPVTLENTSFTSAADSSSTVAGTATQKTGKVKGDFKGGPGKGGFGQFAGVTLTEEQKTALAALNPKPEQKDPTAMKANMEALKAAVKEAFLSTTINTADLKAKLTALQPAAPNFALQAENMIKAYNILTAEQKATLETQKQERAVKEAEMKAKRDAQATTDAAKVQKERPANTSMLDKFGTDLGLTDAQKTSLAAAFAPPVKTAEDQQTREAREAEMKANRDATDAAVKAGDVSKLTELLSSHKRPDNLDSSIARLVTIHDILTAEQRVKLADKIPFGFGHGGPGGHGGKGGPGHGGDKFGHGGPGGDRGGKGGPGHGAPGEVPPAPVDAEVVAEAQV